MTTTLSHLYQLLDQFFNEEELRTLCFDLDIDYDNLGGRGKAANARELVQRLQREGRLPDMLTLTRQRRPQVLWPDPPPPGGPCRCRRAAGAGRTLLARGQRLLAPRVRNPASRDALFSEAFYPAHDWVLDQIDFAGATAVFLPRCWQTLSELAPDGSLHTRLLLTLRPSYGYPEQGQIDDLIVAWQQVCAAQWVAQAVERPSAAQPAVALPGQPTLFLSYADRDAVVARRLAADLAAYGHACRLERAPKTDNTAWLAETAVGLGSSYAVLLLIGEQTATDRWQRLEYLAAKDRQKVIIPIRLNAATAAPPLMTEASLVLPAVNQPVDEWAPLLRRLPPPPPPARQAWAKEAWASEADALRPRLAELAYMDRLKLAELQHVAQYTRLSGQAEIRRSAGGRLQLNPVVARQEFCHTPWRQATEMLVEQRRFADAVAELKAIHRAVLLGDPGSGKTTTFYKLAADLIETALADPSAPTPLMVRLGLWTDAAETLAAFLGRNVGELGEGLDERLAEGRAALLLDGINEIPANQQAGKYAQVRRFLAQYPDMPAWVSCREQDYPPDRDLRLDRVTVAPLDAVRVGEFIHNYLDALPDFGRQAADDLFWQLAGAKERDPPPFYARSGAEVDQPRVRLLAG
ncbi:MAG: TIR domain-containing protein [Chloroflexi bacterium]|nr:TIR domain-containing protein [Chloroflexota bacterium]